MVKTKSKVTTALRGVFFPLDIVGYVVGDSGTILKTLTKDSNLLVKKTLRNIQQPARSLFS